MQTPPRPSPDGAPAATPARRTARRIVLLALKVAVTISLLVFVLSLVSVPRTFALLSAANPSWFALAFGVTVLDQYLGALQVSSLTRTLELRFTVAEVFRINVISSFYQLFLPGSLSGGVARWYMLGNPERRYSRALACVVFNRLVENITAVLAGTLCWWLSGPPALGNRFGLVLLALFATFSSIYLLMFTRVPLPAAAATLGAKLLERLPGGMGPRLRSATAQIVRARSFPARSHAFVFALSVVRQTVGILGFFWLARSISMPIEALQLGWIRSFAQLIVQLPVSIAGLGVREGTLVGLLPLYGIESSAAVALSLLVLARTTLLAVGGGLLEARHRLIWAR